MDVGRQPFSAEAHGRTTTHHHRMASRCSPRATTLPYWVDATADPGSDDFSAGARSSPGPQLHDTVSECTVDGAHNCSTGHLFLYNDGALLQVVGHETGLYSEVWWRIWDTPLPRRGPANEGTPRQGGAEFPTVATKAGVPFASYSGSDELRGPQPRQQEVHHPLEVLDDYGAHGTKRRLQRGCQSLGKDPLPEQGRRV